MSKDRYISDILNAMTGPCGPRTAREITKVAGFAKGRLPSVEANCKALVAEGILLEVKKPGQRISRYIHKDWSIEASRAWVEKTWGADQAREGWSHLYQEAPE